MLCVAFSAISTKTVHDVTYVLAIADVVDVREESGLSPQFVERPIRAPPRGHDLASAVLLVQVLPYLDHHEHWSSRRTISTVTCVLLPRKNQDVVSYQSFSSQIASDFDHDAPQDAVFWPICIAHDHNIHIDLVPHEK